ncbi:MAG: hypothetical protein ACD_74C00093G0002 [uncultured bacterium]|nr:MAG: hypothetical protein ACD_74C00093G0002 [uncultured bacterium]
MAPDLHQTVHGDLRQQRSAEIRMHDNPCGIDDHAKVRVHLFCQGFQITRNKLLSGEIVQRVEIPSENGLPDPGEQLPNHIDSNRIGSIRHIFEIGKPTEKLIHLRDRLEQALPGGSRIRRFFLDCHRHL